MKFCWITINVKDMEKSLHFYQDVVGLKINRRVNPDNNREIVFLGIGETKVELIYDAQKNNITIGEDISLGFEVDSLEKSKEVLKRNNISIHSGPFQPDSSIKFLFVLDPNGVKIQFVENI